MQALMRSAWLVVPFLIVSALQADDNHERDFLTRIRRLTVEGKRAGEGYWSPDGKRLVFQHTDPQNSADLWVVDAAPKAAPLRLSDSMPSSIDNSAVA